jgi:hypothetical protein
LNQELLTCPSAAALFSSPPLLVLAIAAGVDFEDTGALYLTRGTFSSGPD